MKVRNAKSIVAVCTAIFLSITGSNKEELIPISQEIAIENTMAGFAVDEIEKRSNENIQEIESDVAETNAISNIEYKEERISYSNLDFVLEISFMLEKYGMTYQELLELVLNIPAYNQALQNVLTINPNLTTDKLIAILQGKDTSLRENLYLGDSRTKGMLLSGVINEDNSVYGIGYGYKWLTGNGEFSSKKTNALNGAINGLKDKMLENECYNVVIWLGVNDYTYVSANTYFETFEELAANDWSNHNIYIVSVGPVKDSDAVYVKNSGINSFNQSLKELVANSTLNNLYYIDLNLNENSINNYDAAGLHYGTSDYQNIFNLITETTVSSDVNDINSLLRIFYSVLYSYGETFTDYYPNEIIALKNNLK